MYVDADSVLVVVVGGGVVDVSSSVRCFVCFVIDVLFSFVRCAVMASHPALVRCLHPPLHYFVR